MSRARLHGRRRTEASHVRRRTCRGRSDGRTRRASLVHWRMVPRDLQQRVWYLAAAKAAIDAVTAKALAR